MKPDIIVAVGVIDDGMGNCLITRRPLNVAQGGLWEFPGGKVDAGESIEAALARELYEELAITISYPQVIMTQQYDYPGCCVLLHFFRVQRFEGTPQIKAGQLDLAWVGVDELSNYEFPKANYSLIEHLQSEYLSCQTPY